MSLDTAAKRGGAMLLGLPFRGWVGVPSGSLDQGGRQVAAWLGASPLAGAVAVVVRYAFRHLSGATYAFQRLSRATFAYVRRSGPTHDLTRLP